MNSDSNSEYVISLKVEDWGLIIDVLRRYKQDLVETEEREGSALKPELKDDLQAQLARLDQMIYKIKEKFD